MGFTCCEEVKEELGELGGGREEEEEMMTRRDETDLLLCELRFELVRRIGMRWEQTGGGRGWEWRSGCIFDAGERGEEGAREKW